MSTHAALRSQQPARLAARPAAATPTAPVSSGDAPTTSTGMPTSNASEENASGYVQKVTYMDARKARRILANRQSAQRSRARKREAKSGLEAAVAALRAEVEGKRPQLEDCERRGKELLQRQDAAAARVAELQRREGEVAARNQRLRLQLLALTGPPPHPLLLGCAPLSAPAIGGSNGGGGNAATASAGPRNSSGLLGLAPTGQVAAFPASGAAGALFVGEPASGGLTIASVFNARQGAPSLAAPPAPLPPPPGARSLDAGAHPPSGNAGAAPAPPLQSHSLLLLQQQQQEQRVMAVQQQQQQQQQQQLLLQQQVLQQHLLLPAQPAGIPSNGSCGSSSAWALYSGSRATATAAKGTAAGTPSPLQLAPVAALATAAHVAGAAIGTTLGGLPAMPPLPMRAPPTPVVAAESLAALPGGALPGNTAAATCGAMAPLGFGAAEALTAPLAAMPLLAPGTVMGGGGGVVGGGECSGGGAGSSRTAAALGEEGEGEDGVAHSPPLGELMGADAADLCCLDPMLDGGSGGDDFTSGGGSGSGGTDGIDVPSVLLGALPPLPPPPPSLGAPAGGAVAAAEAAAAAAPVAAPGAAAGMGQGCDDIVMEDVLLPSTSMAGLAAEPLEGPNGEGSALSLLLLAEPDTQLLLGGM